MLNILIELVLSSHLLINRYLLSPYCEPDLMGLQRCFIMTDSIFRTPLPHANQIGQPSPICPTVSESVKSEVKSKIFRTCA